MKTEAYKNSFVRLARIERTKMLLDGKSAAANEELSKTLLDFEDYKFQVNEQFEVYNKKTDYLSPIQIEEVLDELIKVKYLNYNPNDNYNQGSQIAWMGCDSDKLQPAGTYKAQYRVKFADHFETAHEQRVRQAQQQ